MQPATCSLRFAAYPLRSAARGPWPVAYGPIVCNLGPTVYGMQEVKQTVIIATNYARIAYDDRKYGMCDDTTQVPAYCQCRHRYSQCKHCYSQHCCSQCRRSPLTVCG